MIELTYRIHITYTDAGDFYEISLQDIQANGKDLDLSYDSRKINRVLNVLDAGHVFSRGTDEKFYIGPAMIDLSKYKDGSYIDLKFSSMEIREFQRDGGLSCKESELSIEDGIKTLIEERGQKEAMTRVKAILDRITVMSIMEA